MRGHRASDLRAKMRSRQSPSAPGSKDLSRRRMGAAA
jgi:hypothetical protein